MKQLHEQHDCPVLSSLPKSVKEDCSECQKQTSLQFDGPGVFLNDTVGLGETLAWNAREKILVACAPRYPVLNTNNSLTHLRGACYLIKRKKDIKSMFAFPEENILVERTHNTIRRTQNGKHYTAYALFGFSVAFNKGIPLLKMFAGAPNAFNREGVTAECTSIKNSPQCEAKKQKMKNVTAYEDNLEGWATSVGQFGKAMEESVAVARPGHGNFLGEIVFYDINVQTIHTGPTPLEGLQLGGWFGYSMAACKVDGDNKDDLMVGAPLSTHDAHKYPDEGMVFVYYAPLLKSSKTVLHGGVPWGRFGTSVACVNLNKDQYTDVVVGAPGERGRVYIYKAGRDGLHTDPTQVLHASEFLPSVSASFGFGFSLAGGLDADDNGLDDILIGAPFSDSAVLVRTSPLISLDAQVSFEPSEMDIDDFRCQIGKNNISVICANLTVDMHYVASVSDIPDMLEINLHLTIDLEEKRLAFYNESTGKRRHKITVAHNITKNKGDNPLKFTVYGKALSYNYEIPVNASVTGTLVIPSPPPSSTSPPPPPPALDSSHNAIFNSSLQLLCERCHYRTDLKLQASAQDYLVVGEGKLHLSAVISCLNDTAQDTTLRVTFPPALLFENSSSSRHSPLCSLKEQKDEAEETDEDVSTLICAFNNILDKEEVTIDLVFSQAPISQSLQLQSPELDTSPLYFNLSVSSSTEDRNITDNSDNVTVARMSQINLTPYGYSDPETVEILSMRYLGDLLKVEEQVDEEEVQVEEEEVERRANTSVSHLGPLIVHQFVVQNSGPSPLHGFQVEAWMPLNYKGARVLYLAEEPSISGPLTCHYDKAIVNPAGFAPPLRKRDKRNQSKKTILENDEEEEEEEEEEEKEEEEEGKMRKKRESPDGLSKEDGKTDTSSSSSSSSPSSTSSSPPPPPNPLPPLPPSSVSGHGRPPLSLLPSSSSSPPPPPPTASSSSPPPPLNNKKGGIKRITIDASKDPSEIITCSGGVLAKGESATIKVKSYVVVGTLNRLTDLATKGLEAQKGATVSLLPKFTFNSTQRCITINKERKGFHDHTCLAPPAPPVTTPPPHQDPAPRNASIPPTDAPGSNGTGGNEEEKEEMSVFFNISVGTYVAIRSEHHKWGVSSFLSLSLWQLLAALFGGLMLFVVIVAVLIKAGFFKREKKLTTEQRNKMRESRRSRRSQVRSRAWERDYGNEAVAGSEQQAQDSNGNSNIGNVFVVG